MLTPHQSGLRWLFLDLNSYFASVEQQERPALRGRPVAIVPMMTDSTCAIAASAEAKLYGIKTGTPIYEAKKLCPALTCVLARHDVYVDYHHRILTATERVLPVHKVWSIDEFDCELLGQERQFETASLIAKRVKAEIRRHVGEHITCSIGIAPTSFLAKVATEIDKRDGLTILPPENLPGDLLRLKLTDLPGINVAMEARLNRAGVMTVHDLWRTEPKQARAIWGSVQGERFWYWLHGYDVPVQNTHTSMIGHSRILDPALRGAAATRQMARRLTVKASYRLRQKNLYAARFYFSVRTIDGMKWSGERQFPAAHDAFTFLEHLDGLWAEMQNRIVTPSPSRPFFKKVSVILHGLKESGGITDDLFDTSLTAQKKKRDRRESLSAALDRLQNKYHRETVSVGVVPKTLAGHVGTKIAFSRVPDREEFWD
jgi:DNA polymerase-4